MFLRLPVPYGGCLVRLSPLLAPCDSFWLDFLFSELGSLLRLCSGLRVAFKSIPLYGVLHNGKSFNPPDWFLLLFVSSDFSPFPSSKRLSGTTDFLRQCLVWRYCFPEQIPPVIGLPLPYQPFCAWKAHSFLYRPVWPEAFSPPML